MTLVSFISFSVFVFVALISLRKGTDIFSPARLLTLIWSLAIGLVDLKLSRFQVIWSSFSWAMLLIAISSMLIGVFIVYVINFPNKVTSLVITRSQFEKRDLNVGLLFKVIIFLFLSYIISFVVTSLVEGYIPLFTFAPDATRSKWGIFGFGLFIQVVPALIYFIMLYFIVASKQNSHKIFVSLLLLITFASYLLILQRFYLVYSALLTIVFLFYSSKKINLKNLIVVLLILFVIVYGISAIRTSRYLINIIHYISAMKYSSKYAFFTEPYMYVVMNLENFAAGVNKLEVFDYGYNSFDFILALSGLKHWIFEYANIQEFPFIITTSFNTYTMFFAYYKDFGVLGLFFVPLPLGMIISMLYYRMRKEPSMSNISLYGIFVFVILFSFFIPILSWLHFIFNLILITIITRLVENKKGLHNNQ